MSYFHYWTWKFRFDPHDLWVGVYWKRYPAALDIYICLLPCLPINLYFQWPYRPNPNDDVQLH